MLRNITNYLYSFVEPYLPGPTEIPSSHSSVLAVRSGDKVGLSKYTIYKDFTPNVHIDNGSTLLLTAIDANQYGMVVILLNHQADPNMADKNGRLPLDAARALGNHDMIALLQYRGAKDAAEMQQVQAVQQLPQGVYVMRRLSERQSTTTTTTTTNTRQQEEYVMVAGIGAGAGQVYQQEQSQRDADELKRLQRMGWNTQGKYAQGDGQYPAIPQSGPGMYGPKVEEPQSDHQPQYQLNRYGW